MTPAELAALLLGDAMEEPRLPERYRLVTAAQETCQAAADSITPLRGAVVAEMNAAGMSYQDIARATGISRARAQQLTEMGRDPGGPVYDDDARRAVKHDAAWWILRHRSDNRLQERSRTQVIARVRRDLAGYSGIPAGEAGRIADEAITRADVIMESTPGWDQRALGA